MGRARGDAAQHDLVVHGEPRAAAELRKRLHDIGRTAVLPNDGERVLI